MSITREMLGGTARIWHKKSNAQNEFYFRDQRPTVDPIGRLFWRISVLDAEYKSVYDANFTDMMTLPFTITFMTLEGKRHVQRFSMELWPDSPQIRQWTSVRCVATCSYSYVSNTTIARRLAICSIFSFLFVCLFAYWFKEIIFFPKFISYSVEGVDEGGWRQQPMAVADPEGPWPHPWGHGPPLSLKWTLSAPEGTLRCPRRLTATTNGSGGSRRAMAPPMGPWPTLEPQMDPFCSRRNP